MKYRLIVFILINFLIARSQKAELVTANVTELCSGDSLQVGFTYTPGTSPAFIPIYLKYSNTQTIVWNKSTSTYHTLYKVLSAGDTIYHVWVKAPVNYVGQASVKMQTSNYFFEMMSCTLTAINEYTPYPTTPIYYNMNGGITTKHSNELLIEQSGTIRRKIYITE